MKTQYVAVKTVSRGFNKAGERRLKAQVQNVADTFRDCLIWAGRPKAGKPVVIRKTRRQVKG